MKMMYSQYNYVSNNNYSMAAAINTHPVVLKPQTWSGTRWQPTTSSLSPIRISSENIGRRDVDSKFQNIERNKRPRIAPPNFEIPQAPPNMTILGADASAQDLVTQYSHFYHYWAKQAIEQRQLATAYAAGSSERNEADRRALWADHYADRSSRAAHHYNDILEKERNPAPSFGLDKNTLNSSGHSKQMSQHGAEVVTDNQNEIASKIRKSSSGKSSEKNISNEDESHHVHKKKKKKRFISTIAKKLR